MILPIEHLRSHDFSLSQIQVILQRPAYRTLSIKKRVCNGFLYLTRGTCVFSYGEESFTAAAGSLVYLPLGSKHSFYVIGEEFEFYRVNFTLHIGEEPVLFSTHPLCLAEAAPPRCAEAIRTLEELCRLEHDTVRKTECLCAVFSSVEKTMRSPSTARLAPAIHQLHQNLTSKPDCAHLASLCFLSTTQFYHLFHEAMGMTPLHYRDTLLLDRAKMLLRFGDISVAEISEMLGFSDPTYFCRFFKKHTGLPPSKFADAAPRTP